MLFKAILLEVLVSLETIKQQNTTILQILQSGNSSGTLHCEPPDVGTLPLPLQSVQDLRSLEQRLCTEPELKKKMVMICDMFSVELNLQIEWQTPPILTNLLGLMFTLND